MTASTTAATNVAVNEAQNGRLGGDERVVSALDGPTVAAAGPGAVRVELDEGLVPGCGDTARSVVMAAIVACDRRRHPKP